jgi:tRNA (guanine-N7-)-methyltransferase
LSIIHNGPVKTPHALFELRTYKLRRSRVTALQAQALADVGERLLVTVADSVLDLPSLTGRSEVICEIGFGMGEATAQLALVQPEMGVLAIDVHTPGVGKLLHLLDASGLSHVRVCEGNAVAILERNISQSALAGVRLFFPDPWPKARHHKRRFVNEAHMNLVAERVKPGGFFHFATDWQDYADQAHEVLSTHARWELLPAGQGVSYGQPHERPRTRFEQRGLDAGREITDLVAVRV